MTDAAQLGTVETPPFPPSIPFRGSPCVANRSDAIPIIYLAGACTGLLITLYWCFVVAANVPIWRVSQSTWFVFDALVRLSLWVTLIVGCVLFLLRGMRGADLFRTWAIGHLVWLPVSNAIAMWLGEVPPEILPAMVPVIVAGGSTSILIIALVALAVFYWLLLPVLALWWLRKHAATASS